MLTMTEMALILALNSVIWTVCWVCSLRSRRRVYVALLLRLGSDLRAHYRILAYDSNPWRLNAKMDVIRLCHDINKAIRRIKPGHAGVEIPRLREEN